MKHGEYRLTLQGNPEISRMVSVLKGKHSINISAYIRKAISDLYASVEGHDDK